MKGKLSAYMLKTLHARMLLHMAEGSFPSAVYRSQTFCSRSPSPDLKGGVGLLAELYLQLKAGSMPRKSTFVHVSGGGQYVPCFPILAYRPIDTTSTF